MLTMNILYGDWYENWYISCDNSVSSVYSVFSVYSTYSVYPVYSVYSVYLFKLRIVSILLSTFDWYAYYLSFIRLLEQAGNNCRVHLAVSVIQRSSRISTFGDRYSCQTPTRFEPFSSTQKRKITQICESRNAGTNWFRNAIFVRISQSHFESRHIWWRSLTTKQKRNFKRKGETQIPQGASAISCGFPFRQLVFVPPCPPESSALVILDAAIFAARNGFLALRRKFDAAHASSSQFCSLSKCDKFPVSIRLFSTVEQHPSSVLFMCLPSEIRTCPASEQQL